jgi:hypothetical protein
MSLDITKVRDDLLSKLGIEDANSAPTLALQDCVIAINSAMQVLNTAGQDYFTRDHLTVTLSAGTAKYELAQSVQAVIGPIRLNDTTPLSALESRGEYDQFDRIFLGVSDFGAAEGVPMAYWVENVRRPTGEDIDQINIWLAPQPTGANPGSIALEVVNDAPNYKVSDLSTSVALPVAQKYTETIFLPIARMFITRSSQFSRPDILVQLTADYQMAMTRLGLAGGFPNVDQPQPPRKVSG